jgi:hypothetical protein
MFTTTATTSTVLSVGVNHGGNICADCGTLHKEIFEFTKVKSGRLRGKEWESIVKPVIERWGLFVDTYV